MDIALWVSEVSYLLKELSEIDLGYPLEENDIILPPASESLLHDLVENAGVPPSSPLLSFFSYCNGVELPDIHVGYFIHKVESILRGIEKGEPVKVAGPLSCNVVVFGSDGGGGRFGLRVDETKEVLYLPVGAVYNSIFDGEMTPVKVLSDNFSSFLLRLKSDIKSFINDEEEWVYMVD